MAGDDDADPGGLDTAQGALNAGSDVGSNEVSKGSGRGRPRKLTRKAQGRVEPTTPAGEDVAATGGVAAGQAAGPATPGPALGMGRGRAQTEDIQALTGPLSSTAFPGRLRAKQPAELSDVRPEQTVLRAVRSALGGAESLPRDRARSPKSRPTSAYRRGGPIAGIPAEVEAALSSRGSVDPVLATLEALSRDAPDALTGDLDLERLPDQGVVRILDVAQAMPDPQSEPALSLLDRITNPALMRAADYSHFAAHMADVVLVQDVNWKALFDRLRVDDLVGDPVLALSTLEFVASPFLRRACLQANTDGGAAAPATGGSVGQVLAQLNALDDEALRDRLSAAVDAASVADTPLERDVLVAGERLTAAPRSDEDRAAVDAVDRVWADLRADDDDVSHPTSTALNFLVDFEALVTAARARAGEVADGALVLDGACGPRGDGCQGMSDAIALAGQSPAARRRRQHVEGIIRAAAGLRSEAAALATVGDGRDDWLARAHASALRSGEGDDVPVESQATAEKAEDASSRRVLEVYDDRNGPWLAERALEDTARPDVKALVKVWPYIPEEAEYWRMEPGTIVVLGADSAGREGEAWKGIMQEMQGTLATDGVHRWSADDVAGWMSSVRQRVAPHLLVIARFFFTRPSFLSCTGGYRRRELPGGARQPGHRPPPHPRSPRPGVPARRKRRTSWGQR